MVLAVCQILKWPGLDTLLLPSATRIWTSFNQQDHKRWEKPSTTMVTFSRQESFNRKIFILYCQICFYTFYLYAYIPFYVILCLTQETISHPRTCCTRTKLIWRVGCVIKFKWWLENFNFQGGNLSNKKQVCLSVNAFHCIQKEPVKSSVFKRYNWFRCGLKKTFRFLKLHSVDS